MNKCQGLHWNADSKFCKICTSLQAFAIYVSNSQKLKKLYGSLECHKTAFAADKKGQPTSVCLIDAQGTLQVFNLSKTGAAEAFIYERNVLMALQTSTETQGIHVLPKLITSSSNCDSATSASIVTEAIVYQVSRGTSAVLLICCASAMLAFLFVYLASI